MVVRPSKARIKQKIIRNYSHNTTGGETDLSSSSSMQLQWHEIPQIWNAGLAVSTHWRHACSCLKMCKQLEKIFPLRKFNPVNLDNVYAGLQNIGIFTHHSPLCTLLFKLIGNTTHAIVVNILLLNTNSFCLSQFPWSCHWTFLLKARLKMTRST